MSRETEQIFREFQKFMDENPFLDEEEAHKAFLQHWNNLPQKDAEPDAYDYLERAQNATRKADIVKNAQKALELDPTLAEAKLLLIMTQEKDAAEVQRALEALLSEEQARLAQMGITEASDAGHYYGLLETRPYMRAYQAYADFLITLGKLGKAAEACRKILLLNESDNLGLRYKLMALYAALEEREQAQALYEKYPEDSAFMLLPLTALYYKLDDTAAADCLKRLLENNKFVKKAIRLIKNGDEDAVRSVLEADFYAPDSEEEFVLAFGDCSFLYEPMPAFILWIEAQLPRKSTGSGAKRKK